MTNKAQQDLLNQLNEYRQTQQLDEIPGKFGQAMKQVTRDLGGVAYDAVARDGYDWRQGVRSQSDPIKTPNATGTQTPAAGNAYLQKASGEAQRKAGLEKKLGTTGAQATAANTAKTAVNKSIARNQRNVANRGGIKTGIDQATKVPGQKGYIKPTTQMMPTGVLGPDGKMTTRPPVDKNKDGKDDQSGKPIAPAGKRPTISGIKPEDPRYPALYKAYMNNMNKTV
jgi:hypothetical protein